MIIWLLSFLACADKEGDTANGGDTGSTEVNNSNCPNEVPEEFRYTWDCLSTDCDGSMVYRYAEGASISNGSISLRENWFVFDGVQPCVDTFEIEGQEATDVNPDLFGCPSCERIFEITWTLTDSQCGLNWTNTFAKQESEDQIYVGYLLMDTHARVSFDEEVPLERSEDYSVIVSAAPVNVAEGTYAPIPDYALGTATPSTADDGIGAPEDYIWSSRGDCYQ